jgi:beta-glucosidase
MAEVDDHVRRIVRSMFATGVIDDPPQKSVVDVMAGFAVSQRIAENSMVLLKNDKKQLPLDASKVRSIVLIGSHADIGMLSGGGSHKWILPAATSSCLPDNAQPSGDTPSGSQQPMKSIRRKLKCETDV